MRGVLPAVAVAALLAGSATAATVRGHGLLVGTPAPDRIAGGASADRIAAAFGGADRIRCGGGRDLVDADPVDRVASDCEVVARRISSDPFTTFASQHATALEPSAASFGSTVVSTFQVGRFEDGGASATGFAVSQNGGRTWQRGLLPGLGRSSDPTVAFDSVHRVWLAANLSIVDPQTQVGVVVSRSPDGLHWSSPQTLNPGPALDKEWIGCDGGASSPFRGRCYVVYSDDSRAAQNLVQTSDDGGVTWASPVRISQNFVGAQPLIRPDGSLVVVAANAQSEADEDAPIKAADASAAIMVARSTDGGATWSEPQTIADARWQPPQQVRNFPLPSTTVDAGGMLYAVWQDCRFRSNCSGNDLVLSTSADGVTWSPVTRVGIPQTLDRFIPGLGSDPTRPGRLGLVYAAFAPGSCATGTCRLEIAFSSSSDGGAHWHAQQPLSPETFPVEWIARTTSGRMIGDYMAVAFANGRAVPVFTLAAPPLAGRYREAIFATSLAVP